MSLSDEQEFLHLYERAGLEAIECDTAGENGSITLEAIRLFNLRSALFRSPAVNPCIARPELPQDLFRRQYIPLPQFHTAKPSDDLLCRVALLADTSPLQSNF